jgi:hypothetical protein
MQRRQFGRLSERIDRHDGAGACIDFCRGVGRVEIEAARQAIDQDRPGTGLDDGIAAGRKGEVRYQDLVAGTDAGGNQAEMQRRRRGRGGKRIFGTDILGHHRLEPPQIGPARQRA